MKPSDVGAQLGVAPVTIRSWSNEFARYMSPTGAGGDGRHRDFTDTDVRTLAFIKAQRAIGRSSDEISIALANMQENNQLEDLPLPAQRSEAEVPTVPAIMVDEARRALMRENAMLQGRISALEAELKDERSDKESLLRELATMNGQLQRALRENELYESGRLKPPQ